MEGPIGGQPTEEDAQTFPESIRAMGRSKCAAFAESITTLTNLSPNDNRVRSLYDNFGHSLGNGQLLLEHELQAFYLKQAQDKPDVVFQNLERRNIDEDLKPKVDWSLKTYHNDDRIVKEAAVLPRVKLSQNHDLFTKMLEQVEKSNDEGLWSLLMDVQTNERIRD